MGANESAVHRAAEEMKDAPMPKWGIKKAPKKVIEFNSRVGGKYRVLSNFCEVPGGIKWKGKRYPSSEHIYQMELKVHKSCWHMFECGGVLGSLGSGFKAMGYKDDKLKKSLKAWGPVESSGRPCMVGIIAKLAINHPAWVEGLKVLERPENDRTEAELIDVFMPILRAKWRDFKDYRVALKAVPKGTTLVEFSQSAEREARAHRSPLWTGHVKDGYLFGKNLGGRLMSTVRKEMLDSEE